MKKLALLSTLFLSLHGYSQDIPKCLSHEVINYQESLTPGYEHHVNSIFNEAKQFAANSEEKTGTHIIPVVVHIVYDTPAKNLPDSVIFDQIAVLNEDFNRQNADTVNMRPDFDIVKGNPDIQFVLAQIDEFGQPTTGITRTQTPHATFGSLLILGGDFSDLERVKSTADGGIDPWDQSRYLNIWVCDMSVFGVTALLGYATPPAGLPNWPPGSTNGMSDGVVIQYQAFGSNNPNPLDPGSGPVPVEGRTPVHEVGHYLGLRHIWGDGDCTAEDGIDDTPNADAQSQSDCDPSKNTCTDNIQGVDLPDMIENFMDYSAETCQNTFTQGQADLMYGVLEVERYDLVHGNPAAVPHIDAKIAVDLYPNPAENAIYLSYEGELSNIKISDMSGKTVLEDIQSNTIDISTFDSGFYFLSYDDPNGRTYSKKFVKK
jgi:hypothetical protein